MSYEVGDKVRVKIGLKTGKIYGEDSFVEKMESAMGNVYTVVEKLEEYPKYILSFSDIWCFTDEMLEPVETTSREISLIFVTFGNTEKAYLYKIQNGVSVDVGEKVYAETVARKSVGKTKTKPFMVDQTAFVEIATGVGIKPENVKWVLGYAVENTRYDLMEF